MIVQLFVVVFGGVGITAFHSGGREGGGNRALTKVREGVQNTVPLKVGYTRLLKAPDAVCSESMPGGLGWRAQKKAPETSQLPNMNCLLRAWVCRTNGRTEHDCPLNTVSSNHINSSLWCWC